MTYSEGWCQPNAPHNVDALGRGYYMSRQVVSRLCCFPLYGRLFQVSSTITPACLHVDGLSDYLKVLVHPLLYKDSILLGGVFPGLVLYLSEFYPRDKLHLRISLFFASASLSSAFSGLLAFGIINMDGIRGKSGHVILFLSLLCLIAF